MVKKLENTLAFIDRISDLKESDNIHLRSLLDWIEQLSIDFNYLNTGKNLDENM